MLNEQILVRRGIDPPQRSAHAPDSAFEDVEVAQLERLGMLEDLRKPPYKPALKEFCKRPPAPSEWVTNGQGVGTYGIAARAPRMCELV